MELDDIGGYLADVGRSGDGEVPLFMLSRMVLFGCFLLHPFNVIKVSFLDHVSEVG